MTGSGEPTRDPRLLLTVDAAINFALGAVLLAAPVGSLRWLGLPDGSRLYPVTLGGVLVGIGIALLTARRNPSGLGLKGAVAINVCGAAAAALWLLLTSEPVTVAGVVVVWSVVVIVLVVAAVELVATPR